MLFQKKFVIAVEVSTECFRCRTPVVFDIPMDSLEGARQFVEDHFVFCPDCCAKCGINPIVDGVLVGEPLNAAHE